MLSKIKRIQINRQAVVKKTPIKVTQKDVDALNRKIAKDILIIKERQIIASEYAEDEIMR